MPMIRKVGYSTADQAVENLMNCYDIEALECWRVRLTELYQVSKHPSVLASMRLLLRARNTKEEQLRHPRTAHGKGIGTSIDDESEGECGQCGRITSLVGGICDQCCLKNTIRDRDQRSMREMR